MIPEMEVSPDDSRSFPCPPAVFRKLDEATAATFPNRPYDEKTWTLDPYVPGQLENALNPGTRRPLWENVQHGRLPLPISAWLAGENYPPFDLIDLKTIPLN
jgi:hypothetical protein